MQIYGISGRRLSHGGSTGRTTAEGQAEERLARMWLAEWTTRRTRTEVLRSLRPRAWAPEASCCRKCGTTERPHHSRGLCGPCYGRWLRAGRPIEENGLPDVDAFEAAEFREGSHVVA